MPQSHDHTQVTARIEHAREGRAIFIECLTQIPSNGKILTLCPHRLGDQDAALSRLKPGFESLWGHLSKKTHLELRDIAVEEFLEMLRFDPRDKLAELPTELLRGSSRWVL